MKTDAEVNAIMDQIPAAWRMRWCGGELGACACMGCVQTGNKKVIVEAITKTPYLGDPEYLSEPVLAKHQEHTKLKLTREEWDAWVARQEA